MSNYCLNIFTGTNFFFFCFIWALYLIICLKMEDGICLQVCSGKENLAPPSLWSGDALASVLRSTYVHSHKVLCLCQTQTCVWDVHTSQTTCIRLILTLTLTTSLWKVQGIASDTVLQLVILFCTNWPEIWLITAVFSDRGWESSSCIDRCQQSPSSQQTQRPCRCLVL